MRITRLKNLLNIVNFTQTKSERNPNIPLEIFNLEGKKMRHILILLLCITTTNVFAFGKLQPIVPKYPNLHSHYSVSGSLSTEGFDCPILYEGTGELQIKEYWYLKKNNNYVLPDGYVLKLKNGKELKQGKVLARTSVSPYDSNFTLTWSQPTNINEKPWIFDIHQVGEHEVIAPNQLSFQEAPAYRVLAVELEIGTSNYFSTTFEPWVFFYGNESTKDVGQLILRCVRLGAGQ